MSTQSIETIKDCEEYLNNNDKDVIALFYRPGCHFCEEFKPKFAAYILNSDDNTFNACAINTENNNEIADKYNIQGVPTTIFILKGTSGKAHKIRTGTMSEQELDNFIKK